MGGATLRKGVERSGFAALLRTRVADALRDFRERQDAFKQDFRDGARRFRETLDAARVSTARPADGDVAKLAALGRVMAGVAHDFNNMLTPILGYAEVILAAMKPGDPLYEAVLEIRKAGQRSAALTRRLLTFSRSRSLHPVIVNPNAVVEGMEGMLRPLVGESIEFRKALDPRLGTIRADAGQIEQVILNLVVNARDAMPRGGRLMIETANVDVEPSRARRRTDPGPGRYVMIAITDTGHGMDESVQSRLFEPFFTTKASGRGTGLGLSMVLSLVKANSGAVSIHSAPGRGTRVEVYLPRVRDPAARQSSGALPAPGGSETILVVEDDEAVRGLACRIFQAHGYTVLSASRGDEALRVCEQHPARINLILVDSVLSDLSGTDWGRRLKAARPAARMLFVSGYPDVGRTTGVANPETAFLRKPFGGDLLLRKVRELLDSPGGERPAS